MTKYNDERLKAPIAKSFEQGNVYNLAKTQVSYNVMVNSDGKI